MPRDTPGRQAPSRLLVGTLVGMFPGDQQPDLEPQTPDVVRDPLAASAAISAARQRPMSERLELALSWNAVAAELHAGMLAAKKDPSPGR